MLPKTRRILKKRTISSWKVGELAVEFPRFFFNQLLFFAPELTDFRKVIDEKTNHLEVFAVEVDKQKMLAINEQNLANSSAKQKEIEQQQIQTKIIERTLELDRLKVEYQYLQRCEGEMQEVFDNFYQNQ